MNIFNSGVVKVYNPKWEMVGERVFSDEEKACIQSTEVVSGTYGLSVCFTLITGKSYIPLSQDSQLGIGETLDLDTCRLLTFERTNPDGVKETCLKVQE